MKSRSSQDGEKTRSLPPTAVMLLLGFDGGIVRKADVALRLARIIFPRIAEGLRPTIDDRGDQWLICNVDRSLHHILTIRKLDAAVQAVSDEDTIHALPTSEIMEKFTAILVESNYGDGELQRQLPFAIVDKGDVWEVLGDDDPDRSSGGNGRLHLEVQKRDAQVLDMSFKWSLRGPHADRL